MFRFRGFIAIDIDVFPKLIEFENDIKELNIDVKLVEPKNIHITLKFLGDTYENQLDQIQRIIKSSVRGIAPFNIKLKGAGVFPNINYIKVIWIGIKDNNILGIISSKIDKQLSKIGFKKEKRNYSPHLTIARVKSSKGKNRIMQIIEKYKNIEFIDFKVDTIKLKRSDLTPKGPIYTDIKNFKL
jgi:2'-5' RNA ligase